VFDLIDKKIERIDRDVDKLRIRIKEADDFKVRDEVFDELTLKVLYRLASSGLIQALGGVISTGKEANVFHALGPDKRELAIKVYRIKTSDFKAMQDYILGDHRFPEPVKCRDNVLVMEFMGKDGIAFPLLKQAINSVESVDQLYQTTIEFMKRLYSDARLIHADLSEYNILVDKQCNPIFIDMGQSVLIEHPRAREFLHRDVSNVIKFFNEHGLTASENALFREITE